jgi:RNA polymerase sigma-B factor
MASIPSSVGTPGGAPAQAPLDRGERAARTEDLCAALAATTDRREQHRLRDLLVVTNMEVARSVSLRYRRRGIADDDLDQVAYVGLVKAAHKFDPHAGHDFLTYAVPTMRGEIRRHFRDAGWMVRPPRRIQELQARITTASASLALTLGRSPTAEEVAAEIGAERAEVEEALAAEGCFTPSSLDWPLGDGANVRTVGDLLGEEGPEGSAAEARVVLGPVVRRLSARDRRILKLRFFDDCTQGEIAEDIGVTQTQVSRLLTRIFADLRAGLGEDVEPVWDDQSLHAC